MPEPPGYKRLKNLYNKENFKSEITSWTENLPDELYQLESEHAKGAELHKNIILEFEGEKRFKTYFIVQYVKSNNL